MTTIIETDKYLLEIRDGVNLLEYTIKEGIVFDAADAIDAKKKLTAARPGEKFFVLGKGIGFFNLTPEARALVASRKFSDNTIAIAFYTPNISLQLLGEMYIKLNKPVVPTRIFKSMFGAREWIMEQMEKYSTGQAGS